MGKRRSPGEGALFKMGDGRWRGRVELPPVAGRRRWKQVTAATRAAARERLMVVQGQIAAGLTPARDERRTLAAWFPLWLAGLAVRPATARAYTQQAAKHILPHLGRERVARLTPARVRAWLGTLAAAGIGARTQQQAHAILRTALHAAVRDGLAVRNAAALVAPPAAIPAARPVLTAADVAILLGPRPPHQGTNRSNPARHPEWRDWRPLWTLAVYTGLRRGELLGLRWGDVGPGAVLHVRGTLDARTGQRGAPKTAAGTRVVPLAPAALAALAVQRRAGATPDAYVFSTPDGAPLSAAVVHRAWHRALTVAGLPAVRFHDLRHTFASLCAEAGVPVKVVQTLLGHASASTTLQIYTHPSVAAQAAGVAALAGLLAAGESPAESPDGAPGG